MDRVEQPERGDTLSAAHRKRAPILIAGENISGMSADQADDRGWAPVTVDRGNVQIVTAGGNGASIRRYAWMLAKAQTYRPADPRNRADHGLTMLIQQMRNGPITGWQQTGFRRCGCLVDTAA